MPIIGWEDASAQRDLITGRIPEAVESEDLEDPAALDVAAAALRRYNVVSNAYEAIDRKLFGNERPDQPQEGYTAFGKGELDGYEGFEDRFIRSRSPQETVWIKNKIDAERRDQQTLQAAGGWGLAASIAAGVIDPLTLATMAVPLAAPVSWGGRGTRIGAAVAGTTALDVSYEAALHASQETRTAAESILNVGAGALLSGLFGTIATRIPKSEFDRMRRALQKEIDETAEVPTGGTAGAARVGDTVTTLEDEGVATGGRFLSGTLGQIVSPLNRLINSPAKATRVLAQRLLEVPFLLQKNLRGIKTPTATESIIKSRINRARLNLVSDFERSFLEFQKRADAPKITSRAFGEEVVRALRRGDTSPIPEVQKLAKQIRRIFDEDKKALQELGVLPEEFQILGAESYFPRVYDHDAIRRRLGELEETLRRWFRNNPKQPADDGIKFELAESVATPSGRGTTIQIKNPAGTRIGHLEAAQRGDDTLQVMDVNLDREIRGQGLSTEAYLDAIQNAQARGFKRFVSDKEVSLEAANIWEALKRRGFKVNRNTDVVEETVERGGEQRRVLNSENNRPVFEVELDEEAAQLTAGRTARHMRERGPEYLDPAEVDSAVQETIENMLGTVRGMADVGHGGARPLKQRKLDVPDELLEPFLVNDLDTVMSGYFRAMAPQIEMRRAFGSTTLQNELDEINDFYRAAINNTADNKAKNRLRTQQAKDINTLVAMRDRVLGITGPTGNVGRQFIRSQRTFRAYNYVRLLGAQMLSSMSDLGHVMTRFGAVRSIGALTKLATNSGFRQMTKKTANKAGTAAEWVLNTRGATLGEIGDGLAGSKLERFTERATQTFTKLSLMASWNDAMKLLAVALEQDAIVRAIRVPGKVSKFNRARLASAGLNDEMLERVSRQLEQHAEETDGLMRMRTELWDDVEAANAVETALLSTADRVVVTKGAGDLPIMMDKELIKTIFQFKSFGMAAVNRIMIPVSQGLAHGDAASASGFAMMLGLGAWTYMAKEYAAGRKPDLKNKKRLAAEALNWSGALGFLPDVYDPLAGAVNFPRLSRYTDRAPLESLLGPSYGTATNLYAGSNSLTDLEWKQSDVHKLRQLMPLQNLFYLRRIINAMEGEAAEATNAEGSTRESFVERVTELEEPIE